MDDFKHNLRNLPLVFFNCPIFLALLHFSVYNYILNVVFSVAWWFMALAIFGDCHPVSCMCSNFMN